MTKNEFIQEAALRILARDSQSSMISIADYAAELAEEVWKRFGDEPQTAEPEVLTWVDTDDTIQVVAKEIARIEKAEVDEKNLQLKARGGWGKFSVSGANVRFVNACHCIRYGHKSINKVEELIAEGRHEFSRRHGAGNKLMDLLDKALENLYGLKGW